MKIEEAVMHSFCSNCERVKRLRDRLDKKEKERQRESESAWAQGHQLQGRLERAYGYISGLEREKDKYYGMWMDAEGRLNGVYGKVRKLADALGVKVENDRTEPLEDFLSKCTASAKSMSDELAHVYAEDEPEQDEWPKYYVSKLPFAAPLLVVHRDSSCDIYQSCGHEPPPIKKDSVNWEWWRQIDAETGERMKNEFPRDLPEEGTGEWAVWRMRKGEIVEWQPWKSQYRISAEGLQRRSPLTQYWHHSSRHSTIPDLLANHSDRWRKPTWSPDNE